MQNKLKKQLFTAYDLKGFSFHDLWPDNPTSRTPDKLRGGQRFMQKDVHLSILHKSKELDTKQRFGDRGNGKKLCYSCLMAYFATNS